MKNKIIIFTLSIISITACNSEKSDDNGEVESTKDEVLNQETGNKSDIDAENEMKEQLNIYYEALMNGDGDKALEFCFPEMLEYFKQEFPEYTEEELKDELVRNGAREMKRKMEEDGVKLEFEIGNVIKKDAWGDNIAYEVTTFVRMSKNLKKISNGGVQIGISEDGGKTWMFIQKEDPVSDDIRQILLMAYPEEHVNKILK